MQANSLHPPNLHTLSENVIGSVLQQHSRPEHRLHNALGPQLFSMGQQHDPTPQGSTRAPTAKRGRPRINSGSSRSVRSSPKQPPAKLPYADEMKANIEEYHRQRRRRNQERYRERQRQLVVDLEARKHELQQEIGQLNRKHQVLMLGVPTKDTVWSVAVEYFRVFRCGLLITRGERIVGMDFLKAVMARDLDAGMVLGVDALARNWAVYTQYFRDVQIRLDRLDQVVENSLVATTTTSITITRNSLTKIFPHLMSDDFDYDKEREWSRIAGRLVNQRLVMRGSVHFNWDGTSNRVMGLITQADMVSPLLQLLGNLEDVSRVFRRARINPESNIVPGEYLDQYTLSY
ncbi:hypothetical protein L915_07140 [Phytophthora nicotianae]|uniref:BZIP domain-containing protein n=1 Tax=Phytophthora nicotianae TaxID=4792 RepID=W2H0G5_PHYNI|nr:hypothetical protein L915_07140 [Phytophthora nicotianae]